MRGGEMTGKEKRSISSGVWMLTILFLMLAAATVVTWQIRAGSETENTGRELAGSELETVVAENSPLAEYAYLTDNATFPREKEISAITIHHMAADLSLRETGELFAASDRGASANYAIDSEGRIGIYVEEKNRAWTSSNSENDARAVTIEVANDEIGGEWHVSDEAYDRLIDLCVDICERNGIAELVFTGDADGNLTMHRMFSDRTQCPGPYLAGRMEDIADEVNKRLKE